MNEILPRGFQQRLEDARSLHRRGEFERTRTAYETHYREDPRNADLVGLMGVLALQQQDPARAESLLLPALGLPGGPYVRLQISTMRWRS